MHEQVRSALEPVLADVRRTTALEVRVEDADWGSIPDQQTARLWVAGSGAGVWVLLSDPEPDQLISMADQVQDWVVENIGGRASNWPACPEHPSTHPLTARTADGVPSWVCPVSGSTVAAIGSLAAAR